ncbi:LysR family transcriptional regulator [Serpens gallinarum]|uniref:LysR family transcriptional regulator n=1 Tax=Serpens gallinarum TaxID=2763075 RepID=A0ABR8TLZ4_9PSED|nr:LysR family transcriptional regulator [Serpens gallinarum]MBD7976791.1 LysR family transcriptional regulator [Serpens gallinarum]
MEFRLLRSFLVVAEELNIGKAAKRLHIAQPPLSKQIQQLEAELDVQLFDRLPKGVKLTPAGEQLVREGKKIRLAVEQAVAVVNKAANGSHGLLFCGFSGALPTSVLPGMIRSIHRFYPGIDMRITRRANSSQVLESVLSGEIDAGLVLLPINCVGLSTQIISSHRLVAVLPAEHALAGQQSIALKDLQNEAFISNKPYEGSVIREVFMAACVEAGFNPKIVQEAEDTYSILMMVAAGLGVAVSLEGVDVINSREVVYVPLNDVPRSVEMAVVWREENPSQLLHNAVNSLNF